MNKTTWKNVSGIIEEFISAQDLLKELLEDKEKEIKKLKEQVEALNEELNSIYG